MLLAALIGLPMAAWAAEPLPFVEEFADRAMPGWTIIDANGDGYTWSWNSYPQGPVADWNDPDRTVAMDDWLISPAFEFKKGMVYTLEFETNAFDEATERLEVRMGQSPTVEGMTNAVMVAKTYTYHPDFYQESVTFNCKFDGEGYIGFHGCSDPDQFKLYVGHVRLSTGADVNGPAAPTLRIVPDMHGGTTGKVTVTAPTKDRKGKDLDGTAISRIELLRDGKLLKTFEYPATGQELVYDDEVPALGEYMYAATAFSDAGTGVMAMRKAHYGFNAPGPVSNIRVRNNADGSALVQWDAPEGDVDGNPIDVDNLQYTIYLCTEDLENAIKAGVVGTEATVYLCNPGEQIVGYVGVEAVNQGGVSEMAKTEATMIGYPYELPYRDEFYGGAPTYVYQNEATSGYAYFTPVVMGEGLVGQSGDAEDGLIYFFTDSKGTGSEARLKSGYINLENAMQPKVSIYVYNVTLGIVPKNENTFDLRVLCDGEETLVGEWTIGDTGPEDSWNKVEASLADFAGKNIQMLLYGRGECLNASFFDTWEIMDQLDQDLKTSNVGGNATNVYAGNPVQIWADVANNGLNAASGYEMQLLCNGAVVATQPGAAVEPGAKQHYNFEWTPNPSEGGVCNMVIRADYPADAKVADNNSAAWVLNVMQRGYPSITDLEGAASGSAVTLTWTDPDPATGCQDQKVEDFEKCEAFAVNDVPGWTFYDMDDDRTYAPKEPEFPNAGSKMAFMTFDASKVAANFAPDLMGHGSSMMSLVDWASGTGLKANDDWAVLPKLPGIEQTVSFWANSYIDAYGNETFRCYYSTGGNTVEELSANELTDGDVVVPRAWTNYSYTLPKGALWFAIRCTSDNHLLFMVDDVCYAAAGQAPAADLVGFNVYRNGQLLTPSPIEDFTFTDPACPQDDQQRYVVTAVYKDGESRPSNVVKIGEVGIESVEGAADGQPVWYDLMGRRVAQPQHGVFIRVNGGKATKVKL